MNFIRDVSTEDLIQQDDPTPGTSSDEVTLSDDQPKTITVKDGSMTKDKECLINVKTDGTEYNLLLKFSELKFGDGSGTYDKDYVKVAKDEESLASVDNLCSPYTPVDQTIEGFNLVIQYYASSTEP
ncbi:unnamed protein product [Echinostoma caproni]|uniref:CUB domain-containing protein n=1 Tax=Echinostoma caproni TaxID=27848 RepID=A0A183ALA7_9TREM|nr:unnamed protein product [Echinostoma caproni]